MSRSVCVLLIGLLLASSSRADDDLFRDRVAPILARRCLSCHSDAEQKGALSLQTREAALRGGESGEVIVAGDPESSYLLELISTENGKAEMPKEADPLKVEEIAAIRNWIAAGAKWPDRLVLEEPAVTDTDWWSLQPLARPALTVLPAAVKDRVRTPIDAFILAKLAENGLEPSAEADRRTLIRRLYFDLIGLPPPPERVEAFVADSDPRAYEKLVDELLASPRYGERWARHWLDVVHYGDTHGYDKDKLRPNAWPYRDYVIRAFNDDTPYGRFIREQLAGDVLYPGEPRLIAATGFIAAGPWDFIGHVEVGAQKRDGRIARNLDRDDMVSNTMQTFCSVTVGCARCHNHKFDPVTQEDYYSLQAVFAAVGRNDRPYDVDATAVRRRLELTARRDALTAERKKIRDTARMSVADQLTPLDERVAQLEKQRDAAKKRPEFGYHSQIEPSPDRVKWVQVDLGEATELERVVLFGCHDEFNGIGAGFGFPVRFRVELADDAQFKENVRTIADQTAADYPNPGVTPIELDAKGESGRYLRVTATRLVSRLPNDYIFALAELQAWTKESKNAAAGKPVTSLDSIEAAVRWGRKNLTDGIYFTGGLTAEKDAELATTRAARHALIDGATSPEQRAQLKAITAELETVTAELKRLPKANRMVYAAATHFKPQGGHHPTNGKPLTLHVLKRGVIDDHLDPVGPGTLRLPGDLPGRFELPPDHAEGDRRIALADWITDPQNPLTWRSIVNRVWHYHFGRGIAPSPNDLGRMGRKPSHPELLDWLAVEFRDGGDSIDKPQSIKALHKLIVTSAVYRQTSAHRDDSSETNAAEIDAGNALLWRANRRRLEAEAIRDATLLVAGKLNDKMYGPGFRDFVVEQPAHSPQFAYEKHDPDDPQSHRRSVYRFLPRSQPQPFMETLDCADPSQQVAQRDETVTPLSALALLNNKFMVRMAEHFAARLEEEARSAERGARSDELGARSAERGADEARSAERGAGSDEGQDVLAWQIERAYGLALGRAPDAEERDALVAYAREHGLPNACRVLLNLNEFVFVD